MVLIMYDLHRELQKFAKFNCNKKNKKFKNRRYVIKLRYVIIHSLLFDNDHSFILHCIKKRIY